MMTDKNSLLYWYPKLRDIRAPQPKTIVVEISHKTLLETFDNPNALTPHVLALASAGYRIGYPLFLRTDQTSGKHDWRRTCYVPDAASLIGHVMAVTEFSECAQLPCGLPLDAMVFRKYIEMDSAFVAFSGMPVSRERRYFVRDGEIVCHHPYWPEEAMQFYDGSNPENWRELLMLLNEETAEEVEHLTAYALEISSKVPGAWSVDFCRSAGCVWYFIDMALAERSWHPECEHAEGLAWPTT